MDLRNRDGSRESLVMDRIGCRAERSLRCLRSSGLGTRGLPLGEMGQIWGGGSVLG